MQSWIYLLIRQAIIFISEISTYYILLILNNKSSEVCWACGCVIKINDLLSLFKKVLIHTQNIPSTKNKHFLSVKKLQ